ncbi:polysaccharide deacetylase family protein, partial [Patescibacteria group bacterium]|nr:polysaccharide deacetylase family protein [Patescibacteria group bacterium]
KETYNENLYYNSESSYELPEYTPGQPGQQEEYGLEGQENLRLKNEAIQKLDRNIAGKKFWDYSKVKIKIQAGEREITWEHDPSVSEGANIYNYSKAVCEAHGMGNMISAVWAIAKAESEFNPFDTHKKSTATGLGQPLESTWASFIPAARKSKDQFIQSILENAYGKGVEYEKRGGQTIVVNLNTQRFPANLDYRNYSRCNPYLNIYATIMGIKKNAKNYERQAGKTGITNFNRLSTEDQLRLLYLSHHDGGAGGPAMLAFMSYISEKLGINIASREQVISFIASNSPESRQALRLLVDSQRARVYRRAISTDPEERAACLRSWYHTCQKVVKFATGRKNFLDTSIPKMRDASEMATAQAPLQQPPQAMTALSQGTLIERAKAAAEASSFQYDCVYILGCGKKTTNDARAILGTKLAAEKGAYLGFSGGRTGGRKISEGQAAFNTAKSNPDLKQDLGKLKGSGVEDQSTDTSGNIDHFVKFAKEHGFKKILIVTTDSGETFPGSRESQAKQATNRLKRAYPEAQVSFYTPERPNIDGNMGMRRATKQTAQVESEQEPQEKEKLSTTELLQIFKSGKKEEIERIIAQYGYPALKEIENQLKNVPQGKFKEDPTGVAKSVDGADNQILLTFDICSYYSEKDAQQVVTFINNVASKRPPVPVVLFVTGNALSNPKIREAIIEASKYPHISIQNHGFDHRPLGTASGSKTPWDERYGTKPTQNVEDAYYELVKGAILTQSITGTKPKFYRSSTLYMDTRGVKMANLLGFQVLGESKTGGDHQKPGQEKAGDLVLRHAKKPSSVEFVDNMRARIQRQEIKPTLNLA